jgi:hypothetical protein
MVTAHPNIFFSILLEQEFIALVEALGPKLLETKKEVERHRNERLRTLGIHRKPGTQI